MQFLSHLLLDDTAHIWKTSIKYFFCYFICRIKIKDLSKKGDMKKEEWCSVAIGFLVYQCLNSWLHLDQLPCLFASHTFNCVLQHRESPPWRTQVRPDILLLVARGWWEKGWSCMNVTQLFVLLKFSLFVKAKHQHHDLLFSSCLVEHSYTHEPMRTEDGVQKSCLIRKFWKKKTIGIAHV